MELKGYTTVQGYECLNSCIVNFLRYEGYNIKSYDVLVIGSGLHITYNGQNGIPQISTSIFDSGFRFLERTGIFFEFHNGRGEEDFSFLQQQFLKKKRIILRVNSTKLSYNKVFHQEGVIQHFVNLTGISKDCSKIKISDGCAPAYQESIYEGWIYMDDFIAAWSEMKFGYIVLDFYNSKQFALEIYNSKRVFYNEMRENSGKFANKMMSKGIFAIKTFRKKVRNSLIDPSCFSIEETSYLICQKIQIGGILPLRKMMYLYFLEREKNGEMAENYKEIVAAWEKLSLLLIKFSVTQRKSDVTKIDEVMDNIWEKEERCMKKYS